MPGFYNPVNSLAFRLLIRAISITAFSLLILSCEQETRQVRTTDHLLMMDAKEINYNRQLVQFENNEIEDYISRHHWKMIQTPTGLRYMIFERGKGKKILKGDEIHLKYDLSLLNGNTIYQSDSLGIKIIYPGTSEDETGLQEALLFMQIGDHAKLIVPSHLAFGLLGDLKKIPVGASLVYDIEILSPARGNR
jgi:FKBP-type peptidyl-prolyl cis-trans isomerase